MITNSSKDIGVFLFEPENQRGEEEKKEFILVWEANLVAGLEMEILEGERDMKDSHPHLTSPRVHSPAELALIAEMEAHEGWGDDISQTGQRLIEEAPGLAQLGTEEAAAQNFE